MVDSPLAPHSSSAAELKERLAAERSGLSFLVFRDHAGKQHIHPLGGTVQRASIGRSGSADISLPWDDQVSGVHAEVELVGGDWTVVDDGLSRNGTFLNGERVQGRRRLSEGDTLRLGMTLAVFRCPSIEDKARGTTAMGAGVVVLSDLSETQRKVLVALCRPFKNSAPFATPATNKDIAEELFLSVDAVKTHLRILYQKFGLEGAPQNQKRAQLVEFAFQTGLIRQQDL